MQKIVLFVEPNYDAWITPAKIGNIFMNRFAIDEDASSEISNISEFLKTSLKISFSGHRYYKCYTKYRLYKGMDHLIVTTNGEDSKRSNIYFNIDSWSEIDPLE